VTARQLLRDNGVFGPEGVDGIALEVWQDSGVPVRVEGASLEISPARRGGRSPIERC
jgi:hypothetical protein